MSDVVAWLERLLPAHEPELWASLQPPAEADELESLRQAASPFEVTDEWPELLRWHNGGPWGGPWWPLLESGHLLGVRESIEHYQWLCANTEEWQWHRSWLPIVHDGWAQCGIELDGDYRGLIVDGSFPDPPRRKHLPGSSAPESTFPFGASPCELRCDRSRGAERGTRADAPRVRPRPADGTD